MLRPNSAKKKELQRASLGFNEGKSGFFMKVPEMLSRQGAFNVVRSGGVL